MITAQHGKLTWIDFENPGAKDILFLQKKYNFDTLAIEEFATPTYRPSVTVYDDYLFLTIHVPLYDREEKTTFTSEVDVIITRDTIITGHRDDIYQLTSFIRSLQRSAAKRNEFMSGTPAELLYYLWDVLMTSCFRRLDHVSEKIDWIEEQIFSGNEREMVQEISFVKRDILNFRRALKPQRSIVESLISERSSLLPNSCNPFFRDLSGTFIRLWNTLQSNKETIESLEETNNSLLSNKINEKMKVITVFTAALVPMTLYANVLGINVTLFSREFFTHLTIMFLLSALALMYFKFRQWV